MIRQRTSTVFRCGHPKSKGNSLMSGQASSCRICTRARQSEYFAKNYSAPVLPPRRQLDLSNDPAVIAYRTEKAKRENRTVTAIESVRPQYPKAIEKPKGGRPVSVERGRRSA